MTDDGVAFALARLDNNSAIEIRDKTGKILSCGGIVEHRLESGTLTVKTEHRREILPDCPKDLSVTSRTISISEIEFVEIITPQSEFYVFANHDWHNAIWTKPVKKNSHAFLQSTEANRLWQRYARPPKGIPGVFWPELRLGTGVYALTRTQDTGVPAALALDFKIHRAVYALSLFVEFTYGARLTNGDATVASPARYYSFGSGITYAFFQRAAFSLSAILGGGGIHYSLDQSSAGNEGLRPVITGGFMFSWHVLRQNRDYHKLSLFTQPLCSWVINRNEANWANFPLLFELRVGVQYAY